MCTSENAGLVERLSNRDLVVGAAPVSVCLAIPSEEAFDGAATRGTR